MFDGAYLKNLVSFVYNLPCGIQVNVMLCFSFHFFLLQTRFCNRVLGYLIFGTIRIFFIKVEYVLEDCNEVLIKINKFVVNNEGLFYCLSNTLLSETEFGCKTKGFGLFSQEKACIP